MILTAKEQLIIKLGKNPRLAHQALFTKGHSNDTPYFHFEIIDLWHDETIKHGLVQAFRGAAKSTIAEEAIIIQALYRKFHNGIILGETYERAVERLRKIKHEFESNEFIKELFGDMVGSIWSEGKIVLTNGCIIQAFGRGQSLRGSKHLDYRPDRAFGDDIEDDESVRTPEAIDKTISWFVGVVLPALDPNYSIRINGTPLHPRSLICLLNHDSDWVSRKYPIKYKDEKGEWRSSWPDRLPIEEVDKIQQSNYRLGKGDKFQQEYMCEAEDPAEKPFTPDMFKVEPVIRVWHTVYSVYDPARTINKSSATTGVCHFSWQSNRLIIWDAYGRRMKPDEIISDIFASDQTYSPAIIGVEADGLHEFILQPLRQEQLRRNYSIPIRALKAPKGKIDFIKSLQPFFKAHEITFAKSCEEAVRQFLSFPSGEIDIPNALAYALTLRPGQLIYETFSRDHIVEAVIKYPRDPFYLCLNAISAYVTGLLLQFTSKGDVHVLKDWVYEGDSSERLAPLVAAARMELASIDRATLRFIAGPIHFDRYSTSGLKQAARQIPLDLLRGGQEIDGREEIKRLLQRANGFKVASAARWTLNGLSAGYAKEITKAGVVTEFATDGPYRRLIEGLESFAATMRGASEIDNLPVTYAVSPDGRRYISSLGGNEVRPSKDNWADLLRREG
jgi:hypothetical protein